jgi:hypothetical protein
MYTTIRTNIHNGNIEIPDNLKKAPEGTECVVILFLPSKKKTPSFQLLYSMANRAVPAIPKNLSSIDSALYTNPHR